MAEGLGDRSPFFSVPPAALHEGNGFAVMKQQAHFVVNAAFVSAAIELYRT